MFFEDVFLVSIFSNAYFPIGMADYHLFVHNKIITLFCLGVYSGELNLWPKAAATER